MKSIESIRKRVGHGLSLWPLQATCIALAALQAASALAQETPIPVYPPATAALRATISEHWSCRLSQNPAVATSLGVRQFEGELTDIRLEAGEGACIRDLRRRAEGKLGLRFDLRSFHDAVLDSEALRLDSHIERWTEDQNAGGNK